MQPQSPPDTGTVLLVGMPLCILLFYGVYWTFMRIRQGNLRQGLQQAGRNLGETVGIFPSQPPQRQLTTAAGPQASASPTVQQQFQHEPPAAPSDRRLPQPHFVTLRLTPPAPDAKPTIPEVAATTQEAEASVATEIGVANGLNETVTAPVRSVTTPVTVTVTGVAEDVTATINVPTIDLLAMTPQRRQHTIVTGRTGDGKTQTSIALLVHDIARGKQVVWINPHLALYHPDDQPTDLRSLRNHFEQVFDYAAITQALEHAHEIVDQRMPYYRAGEDVGHDIVLYIDEWPAIADVCGELATRHLKAVLREGRKCRVWAVVATQDAQVETLGLHSGLRESFATRLIGNVDPATWLALVGPRIPKIAPPRLGVWVMPGDTPQFTHISPASRALIARIALNTSPHNHAPIVPPQTEALSSKPIGEDPQKAEWTSDHVRVASWLAVESEISVREVARRLYPSSDGGGSYSVKAGKILDQVLRVTDNRLPVVTPQ